MGWAGWQMALQTAALSCSVFRTWGVSWWCLHQTRLLGPCLSSQRVRYGVAGCFPVGLRVGGPAPGPWGFTWPGGEPRFAASPPTWGARFRAEKMGKDQVKGTATHSPSRGKKWILDNH